MPASKIALAAGLLLSLAALAATMTDAEAGQSASDWQGIPEAEVRLIAGQTPDGIDMIGLDFVIAPKWKVYWRSPGDAGFPPIPDWSGNDGVVMGETAWPLPQTFMFYGLRTYGYEHQLILPVAIQQRDKHRSTKIGLHLSYAACADICVPVDVSLVLDLPAGDLPRNRHGKAIKMALGAAPDHVADALHDMRINRSDEGPSRMTFRILPPAWIDTPQIIIEGLPGLIFGDAVCTRTTGNALECAVGIEGAAEGIAAQQGQPVTVTVHGAGRAIEATGLVAATE
ncbi:MAG: protein-disulfide reductase DsbD family protein [Minwuia sp.]|nr:protein-disulfide reductase DsbD family protein [Minwuia sp.]